MKYIATFVFIAVLKITLAQIEGTWYTSFVLLGKSLSLKMEISSNSNKYTCHLTDLDSTFVDQKMSETTFKNDTLYFEWTQVNLSFEGILNANEDSISGIMTQNGLKWDVDFTRLKQTEKKLNRPQLPGDQSGYLTTQEIEIKNEAITLSGTFTIPLEFNEKNPIVVLASGSGPQNRDSELMGHQPFLIIADRLAKKGIASLRFDDRGFGKSSGSYKASSLMDFGSDITAWVDTLKQRYPKNKIGIIGHSEGGMHALIAANSTKNVDFIVELASIGTSGKDIILDQQYSIPKQEGRSEEYCNWNVSVFDGACQIISQYDQDSATDTLSSFLRAKYEIAPDEYKENTSLFSFVTSLVMFFNNDWAREFVNFKTADYLKQINIPMLIINGEKDIQVPAQKNQIGFEKGMSPETKRHSEFYIIEGVNHLFQTCEKCTIMEYAEIEETFSEKVLDIIGNWILNQ